MADTVDSKSTAERLVGSTPTLGTIYEDRIFLESGIPWGVCHSRKRQVVDLFDPFCSYLYQIEEKECFFLIYKISRIQFGL